MTLGGSGVLSYNPDFCTIVWPPAWEASRNVSGAM